MNLTSRPLTRAWRACWPTRQPEPGCRAQHSRSQTWNTTNLPPTIQIKALLFQISHNKITIWSIVWIKKYLLFAIRVKGDKRLFFSQSGLKDLFSQISSTNSPDQSITNPKFSKWMDYLVHSLDLEKYLLSQSGSRGIKDCSFHNLDQRIFFLKNLDHWIILL